MTSIGLGIRFALAAGREGLARLALTAFGVALGVTFLLTALTALPALEGRSHRLGWHNTSPMSPATAADAALWLGVPDHYAGENLFRVHVAALGPNPPVPGLSALPGPGELVAVVGGTREEIKALGGEEVRGLEPGGPFADAPVIRFFLILVGTSLLLPVIVFIAMVTRIAAARREQRFAALRLAGATRMQTALMAATETGLASILGTALGFAGYLGARRIAAAGVTYEGEHFVAADVVAPAGQAVLVLAGVPLLAVLTTIVGLYRVQVTPLGVGRRARRDPPGPLRLVPLALGVCGFVVLSSLVSGNAIGRDSDATKALTLASVALTLSGIVFAGPWICALASRALARVARNATTLMAARRIASDPFTAFRAISGVVLAVFVTTTFASFINTTIDKYDRPGPTAMLPGVVEIATYGKPVDPNAFGEAAVARMRPDGTVALSCAEFSRYVAFPCPAGLRLGDTGPRSFWHTNGIAEPVPSDAELPVQAVFVRTDGSVRAEERVRTRAARLVPGAVVGTHHDNVELESRQLSELDTALRLATMFVLLVAACSLTVSVIAGLIERRRPLALLRATGVRVGELRRMVLLEAAMPLALTVLVGIALGLVASYALGKGAGDEWSPPGADFALSMAIGVTIAFAVTTVALPLMDVATRHNAVRYE
jgi:hypothetical protein